MYLRFVSGDLGHGRLRSGIFAAAYDLLRSDSLDHTARREIDEGVEWFELSLRVPPRNAFHDPRAICWFYSDAQAFVARGWQLVRMLRHTGLRVEMILTKRVGQITFDDGVQVVAIPFADTFGPARRSPAGSIWERVCLLAMQVGGVQVPVPAPTRA